MKGLDRLVIVVMSGALLAGVLQPAAARGTVRQDKVDFARDVLPILSEKCFLCHGPDPGGRQAGLRLDVAEGAYADRGGRFAVVPGKPDESLMVQRIHNADAPMPPVVSGKVLTDAQKAVLTEWIREGAQYSVHWAFVPLPSSVPVPDDSSDWVLDDLDAFVLSRLVAEGLSPSREASRERWLRRVTYDVTGLPPLSEDVSVFLSSGDYAAVVDRLLASPRYGEKMAAWWLDAARYADSYGYQSDLLASVWPYRDWVVGAFNRNLPYDQFLTEQIAGDLLPSASRDQVLATAFNRLHRMTNEGGSIELEYKTEYAIDRAETFGTAFLGLTVGCARCHDHKYDPLKQKEYYQLFAYFNSIDDRGLYNGSEVVPAPSVLLPTAEQEARGKELRDRWLSASNSFDTIVEAARANFEREVSDGWRIGAVVHDVLARVDLGFLVGGKYASSVGSTYAQPYDDLKSADGRIAAGVVFDGDDGLAVRGLPDVDVWDEFTWSFWVRDDVRVDEPRVLLHKTGGTDTGFAGMDLMLLGGRLQARMYRDWPGNAFAVESVSEFPARVWANIAWSYDGSGTAAGLRLYLNGKPLITRVLRDEQWKQVRAFGDLGPSGGAWAFGHRFRCLGFKGGRLDEVTYASRALTPIEVQDLYDGVSLKRGVPKPDVEMFAFYANAIEPSVRDARARVVSAHRAYVEHQNSVREVPVMRETPLPIRAYLLSRGQYDSLRTPDNLVSRGVPAFLPPMPTGASADRLGLAQWAVGKDHPLTARVLVNRVWQALFGVGLVRTAENFGILGEQPSHPELLDYLARWFVDNGWDVKALVRKIVLSATYRQDSALTSALLEKDPENRLLARGPSHRMDAEMVRDTVLFASGLLDERIGGPPVNPYQPGGIWTENNAFSPQFVQSKGPDLYRRSLYTTWKRTTPAPDMLAFDATGREACVMRRSRTSTPMQALVMLNDVQYVEAARVLAERVLKSGGSRSSQVSEAFMRLAGRAPSVVELAVLMKGLDEQFDYYRGHLAEAIDLASEGDRPREEALRASEVAAMTVTVQTIMNMDAVVWKR